MVVRRLDRSASVWVPGIGIEYMAGDWAIARKSKTTRFVEEICY